ncbi:hypothetical protein BDF20DRAFT_834853 [Mycotypha africana]|uniref:uncharacterized protein n=1 Tax=Mycotypha africana TaxID=64632 RepID=UPI0023015CFE|nr:uncharacterized protein BDF20DRAFT_834853 [Mycotypha africana]KAI8982209.1 hypothetical protein BDF20DRAFT_834853 [Mycotypha africana]
MPQFMESSRWRRMGWLRFLIYFLILFLILHLFTKFTTLSSNQASSPTQQQTKTPPPIIANDVTLDSNYQELRFDFPWYKTPHPALDALQNPQHTTTKLSEKKRDELTKKMIDRALEVFRVNNKKKMKFEGILGSVFKDQNSTQAFRDLVDCWTTGEWVRSDSHFIMPHFQDAIYGKCDKRFRKEGGQEGEYRDAVKWVWKSKCDVQMPFQRERLCDVLRGRHILLVGDLVHYQMHEVLLDSMRNGPTVCFGELNCKDHTLCEAEPKVNMRYLRNDLLSVRQKMYQNHGHPKADVIEWPFTQTTILRTYPIVILSRGLVHESDEAFIDGLVDAIQTIRKQYPKTLVIYRSTSIGHPYCDDATGPLKKPLSDKELKRLPFGWSELKRRNQIARAIVEAAGGLFVDLAALEDLRPDGHIGGNDCLRYCIPGPLDSEIQILYQIFLGLEGKIPLKQ